MFATPSTAAAPLVIFFAIFCTYALADTIDERDDGAQGDKQTSDDAIQSAIDAKDKVSGQLISSIGSERATSGGGNKIVTYAEKTHVVWQDVTEDGYFNRIRTLNHASGEWSETFTLNEGSDNHARPVLTIDQEGYLHAIMSGHNSPVTHRRFVRPNDSSKWTDLTQIGKGTYPIVACGPDGSLYVTMRSAERWNGVDLYVKRPGQTWETQCKLVQRHEVLTGYAAFHAGLAFGKDGILHCVVDFYESKGVYDQLGLHQAVCYLRSRDQGVTWEKADGSPIELPARPEQLDILARTTEETRHEPKPPPEVLAQGCIITDRAGVPHVLYISHLEEPGQLIHAWPGLNGVWHRQPIEAAKKAFPDHRATGCRGALSIDAGGTFYALLELQPLGDGWVDGKPTRAMNWNTDAKRLVWLISRDRGQTWSIRSALPAGTAFNEANVERPTGVNIPAADTLPPFVYFDGTSRYPKEGEILQNNVYLVLDKGEG
jgi:hypothetical protein